MALTKIGEKYAPRDNAFYRQYSHYFFYAVMGFMVLLILAVGRIFFQVLDRPLPQFTAVQPNSTERMVLTPFEEPNLLPDTLIRFASKAASLAYTFDFANYKNQIALARPYFTEGGWVDFNNAISGVVKSVVAKGLFVSGVVSGTPVISNQGVLPGQDYVWRIQIPFLVKYSSDTDSQESSFIVVVTLVRVPTSTNSQGIGIDQFIMVGGGE